MLRCRHTHMCAYTHPGRTHEIPDWGALGDKWRMSLYSDLWMCHQKLSTGVKVEFNEIIRHKVFKPNSSLHFYPPGESTSIEKNLDSSSGHDKGVTYAVLHNPTLVSITFPCCLLVSIHPGLQTPHAFLLLANIRFYIWLCLHFKVGFFNGHSNGICLMAVLKRPSQATKWKEEGNRPAHCYQTRESSQAKSSAVEPLWS